MTRELKRGEKTEGKKKIRVTIDWDKDFYDEIVADAEANFRTIRGHITAICDQHLKNKKG